MNKAADDFVSTKSILSSLDRFRQRTHLGRRLLALGEGDAESDLPAFFEHQRDPVATRMAAFASRESSSTARWPATSCRGCNPAGVSSATGSDKTSGAGASPPGRWRNASPGDSAAALRLRRQAQRRLDPGPREVRLRARRESSSPEDEGDVEEIVLTLARSAERT